jgi:23S rRNA-intervening sequence protein
MEYVAALGSVSTLVNVSTLTSVSGATIPGRSNLRRQIGLGYLSPFNFLELGPLHGGWSFGSSGRVEREIGGSEKMQLLNKYDGSTRRREGASRDSKKDYLHFLYIARGSLSETQYFVHLAGRLGYLASEEVSVLQNQTKQTFGCLHGLIRAVEKEAGKFSKMVATVTSLLVIGLAHWSRGQ